jgi:predicted dehydrogenase
VSGVETVADGFERLQHNPEPGELGIVATPTASLVAAAQRLASLGFHRLLIEKPVSLWSREIDCLSETLEQQGVETVCGYNRVAYPSFHEVRARAAREGGITSCTYTFTEMIKPDWPERFPPEELARWGIANSLHVISMAHGLIGMPAMWSGHRSGALPWHPTGTVFVGSGISDCDIPFAYHADWGSTGRWSVEVHTRFASYRLCPLERVYSKRSATGDWEEIPIVTFAPETKAGIVEQVAAMLSGEVLQLVPLVTIRQAGVLTKYAEELFGYPTT